MIIHSMATFYDGEILRLREDMGGGYWRVVRWWSDGEWCHAEVVAA